MEKTIISATVRKEKPNKLRRTGFIPGVLNGPGTASSSVQFENTAMSRAITKHGSNAKVWVDLDGVKKFGFIKAIQRDPVEGKLLHVSIQLVSENQEVRMQLPISFHGLAELERKQLHIEIRKSEVEVSGITELMPDSLTVNVSEKASGDTVTSADFSLSPELKVIEPENEIYAAIKEVRIEPEQEPEEAKPVE